MEIDPAELEQEFRQSWRDFDPQRYTSYLDQADATTRTELLARLLSAELEFAYQPPTAVETPVDTQFDDDDQRIKPCVQLFLLRFPELAQKPELIIRLIVLEYALRLRHDSLPPNPESYLALCSQSQERLIKLLELTESKLPRGRAAPVDHPEVGHSDSTVKESPVSQSISLDPLPLNLGCFLLMRLLGRGGMGYVHAAIDLRSTAQVAVKVMRRVDAWSVYRFIEEFSWLSQLSHPNLVKLYDAFCDGDMRYFSMELVEGKTIREWFKRISGEDHRWSELRRVRRQLASAIHYLHEHGVVHCDIKCSNMMITSGRRAVVLDLGLAMRSGQQNRLVGTLQYMAPEILMGGSTTYASDWHSFGVMLYEVITNSFPPVEIDLSDENSENERYRMDYDRLRQNLEACPADLAELCLALMQLEPASRPSGQQVLDRLGGEHISRPQAFRTELECEGRDQPLHDIDLAVHSLGIHPASLVVIQGESGSGKSTLLQSWIKNRQPADSLLLSVRCYQQDHTPVRLLNSIVQALVQVAGRLPVLTAQQQIRINEISVLFPQVQQLADPHQNWRPRERVANTAEVSRDNSIQSLLQWLTELSHQQRMIVCIDDAQWADAESLRALRSLLSRATGFSGTVVAVDESDDQFVLQSLKNESVALESEPSLPTMRIALGALEHETCEQLLTKWAHNASISMTNQVANNIATRSSGNPFLLLELFRTYLHHMQRGDLHATEWLATDSQVSVRRRFSLLPIQAENILQYLAVADQSIGLHQLQMVSRILPHELQHTLSFLASQGWIRSQAFEYESDLEIAHETFRRVILQSMPVERIHRRHYRMARILSSETPPPWARIAAHYWSAEHFREAATCYLEAARSAIACAAAEEALEFLDRADHPNAERTPQEHMSVLAMKANCLARLGSSWAAAKLYEQLLEAAALPREKLLLECRAGEQWIRAGQLEPGLTRLESALQQFGIDRPRTSSLLRRARGIYRGLRIGLSSPRKHMWKTNGKTADRQPFTEIEQCLNRLATPLTFLDNQLGPELILRLAELAEAHGSDYDRSLAMLRSGILVSFAGNHWRKRALTRLRTGRQLARQSGADEARGTAEFCMFVWDTQRGRLANSLRHGQAALRRYQQCASSTQWEQQFLKWAMLGCYWYANDLQTLKDSTRALRQSAHHRADSMSLFWAHVSSAHLSDLVDDQTERARSALAIAADAIANQTFQSPRFFLWISRIQQALYEQDVAAARSQLEQDWRQLAKHLVLNTNHYRWLALCASLCCDLSELHAGGSAKVLTLARQNVRRLQKMQEPAFNEYGNAFSLVVEAHAQRRPAAEDWHACIRRLRHQQHHLMASALAWHFEKNFSGASESNGTTPKAEAAFREQGCVAPQKLLNIILPLSLT